MSFVPLNSGSLGIVFLVMLAAWVGGAVSGYAVPAVSGRRISYTFGIIGDLAALLVASSTLLGSTLGPWSVSSAAIGTFVFFLSQTGAAFLLLTGISGFLTHMYCLSIGRSGNDERSLAALLNVLPIALAVLFVANDLFSFLLAWEAMSLLTYLVVFTDYDNDAPLSAYLFIGLNEAGALAVIASSAVLYVLVGSTSFNVIRNTAGSLPMVWRSIVFVLVLAGFGVKAGLVPFHVWAPRVYRVSPNRANAFLATAVESAGLFGIFQYALWLLGSGPEWWGLLAVALGGITALLGALYALITRDLDGVLAYSSIENMGLTVIAVGAGIVFEANNLPAFAGLAYLVAVLHALNHATFKATLFLAVDAVEQWTGTTVLDELGSLARLLPIVTLAFVASAAAISAMPPFNGVVSEWLLFQVLFQSVRLGPGISRLVLQVAGAALALTSGLVLATFVRASGIGFLSDERTDPSPTRADGGAAVVGTQKVALLAGVLASLLFGLFPTVIISALAGGIGTIAGSSLTGHVSATNFGLVPIDSAFAEASPFWAAITATVIVALGYSLIRIRQQTVGATVDDRSVWTNGVEPHLNRHQYSAIGMSVPLVSSLTSFYQGRHNVEYHGENKLASERESEFQFLNIFQTYLYRPLIRRSLQVSTAAKVFQSGNVNVYVGYILVFLLFALLYLAFS